jgi:hypothetical protein
MSNIFFSHVFHGGAVFTRNCDDVDIANDADIIEISTYEGVPFYRGGDDVFAEYNPNDGREYKLGEIIITMIARMLDNKSDAEALSFLSNEASDGFDLLDARRAELAAA